MMNFTAAKQEVITQEKLLLDTVERIGRIRDGYVVLHLHLSRLRPPNRQDAQLRIALRMLEPLVHLYRGQMFLLTNSDIIVLCKEPRPADIEEVIYRLRALFGKDPLTFGDAGDGVDRFFSQYDLTWQYDPFLSLVSSLAEMAKRRQAAERAAGPEARPLDPKGLGEVLKRLSVNDIAAMVRRQSGVAMDGRDMKVAYQEFFVSMPDLQKVVAPEYNLMANIWLFQHFTQTLDQRMLTTLQSMGLRRKPVAIGLNSNVTTLFTPAFKAFEQWLGDDIKLNVELQVIDVFADLGGYFFARDWLRGHGHKVVIDGLSSLSLDFMEPALYGADYYKVNWSPEYLDKGQHAGAIALHLAPVGLDSVILARCDSEQAIQWGMSIGLNRFQGRYIDAMLAAVTMSGCDKASACTFRQCIHRRTAIAGRPRAECGNLDMLDAFPEVRAPKRVLLGDLGGGK